MTRKKASGVRRKGKSGKSKSSVAAHSAVSQPQPSEIETLLQELELHMNALDYDSAKSCCQKILTRDPDNVKAMEVLASILMDMGDFDGSEKLYLKCVELSPDENYEKYFSLAQINEGKKSLEYYEKGIEIIRKELQTFENAAADMQTPAHILKRAISDAYCSIVELYTTDLCDEEDAEVSCKKAIEEAAAADPDNPDVYQCMANFALIKSEDEEAVAMMKKSLSLWLPHHEALRDKAEIDPDSKVIIPEYTSRVKTSQLLIELEMFEEATKVLDGLLEENDQDYFVWFLLGWSNYIHGDDYKGNAFFYLEKSKEVAKKNRVENVDVLHQLDELLEELKDYGGDCDQESDKENGQPLDISSSGDEDDQEECQDNEVDMEL